MLPYHIQHLEFNPPEHLKDIIKCFWYDKREFCEYPALFEVVPDGYTEIIFHFGGGCKIDLPDGLQELASPFIMGLLKKPARFYMQNKLEIIAIRCFPWAVFNLLALPCNKGVMSVADHQVVALQDTLTGLIKAGRVANAIEQVSQYFTNAYSQTTINKLLSRAGTAMIKAKGDISVNQVASAAFTTTRTLERNFKQASGNTVKDVAGLMRFEEARNRLLLFPDTNLSSLAHELGYSDQSHLSREFKRYSGTTPTAFARDNKKQYKL